MPGGSERFTPARRWARFAALNSCFKADELDNLCKRAATSDDQGVSHQIR